MFHAGGEAATQKQGKNIAKIVKGKNAMMKQASSGNKQANKQAEINCKKGKRHIRGKQRRLKT